MRRPRMTVRRVMISVGLTAVMLALHTPLLRDVFRHGMLIRNHGFRSNPGAVMRENYIYSLSTVPSLIALGLFDILILLTLICWRQRWGTGLPRSSMLVDERHTRAREYGDS